MNRITRRQFDAQHRLTARQKDAMVQYMQAYNVPRTARSLPVNWEMMLDNAQKQFRHYKGREGEF